MDAFTQKRVLRLRSEITPLQYENELYRSQRHHTLEFSAQTENQHANDLLCQVWLNSQILTVKFNCLKLAFIFMALAIPIWISTLVLFAANGSHSALFKP